MFAFHHHILLSPPHLNAFWSHHQNSLLFNPSTGSTAARAPVQNRTIKYGTFLPRRPGFSTSNSFSTNTDTTPSVVRVIVIVVASDSASPSDTDLNVNDYWPVEIARSEKVIQSGKHRLLLRRIDMAANNNMAFYLPLNSFEGDLMASTLSGGVVDSKRFQGLIYRFQWLNHIVKFGDFFNQFLSLYLYLNTRRTAAKREQTLDPKRFRASQSDRFADIKPRDPLPEILDLDLNAYRREKAKQDQLLPVLSEDQLRNKFINGFFKITKQLDHRYGFHFVLFKYIVESIQCPITTVFVDEARPSSTSTSIRSSYDAFTATLCFQAVDPQDHDSSYLLRRMAPSDAIAVGVKAGIYKFMLNKQTWDKFAGPIDTSTHTIPTFLKQSQPNKS